MKIYLILVLTILFCEVNCMELQSKIDSIPAEDQVLLERFFHHLVIHSPFAFTLWGEKPISWEAFFHVPENFFYQGKPNVDDEISVLKQGIELWRKYAYLFPSNRFCLTDYCDENSHHIIIINKAACKKVMAQNKDLFENKFKNMTFEEILKRIQENGLFNELEHDLLGILFGFGRANSLSFKKQVELKRFFQDNYSTPDYLHQGDDSFPNIVLEHNSNLKDTIFLEQLNQKAKELKDLLFLRKSLYNWDDKDDGHLIFLFGVGFVIYHQDAETKHLCEEYKKTHKKILAAYNDHTFLKTTLKEFVR